MSSFSPMMWVYVALVGAMIWGIWGRTDDDIMF